MVGANYMGGKRNTARAKSKDIVGRAQRRHFGKQRLASALCATQENRIHPSASPTLSSVLPEIALAHARCDASTDSGASSSRKVFSGDRLYSSTLPSNTPQRNKPSKVLGALDISDQDMSMRAAIDRILQQPNLVGINNPKLNETAYIERMQTSVAVRPPTKGHIDSEHPNNQHPETASMYVFDPPVSYSQPPKRKHMDLPETDPNLRYERTESGVLSPPDIPSGICGVVSWNTSDDSECAEVQSFSGANPFFCTEGDELERPNTFLHTVYPLPRSSPFTSNSQSSDNSILDLDTSPPAAIRFGRSDDLCEENDDFVDASLLRSIYRPIFRQPSRSYSVREASVGVDEAPFTISSSTDSDEDDLEAERSRTTYYNDTHAFPSTGNNDFRNTFPSDHGCDSIRVLTSQEDNLPSGISIDFLSDPHPWETIGRILELKPPEPSAAQSLNICFTKDREGVGYVSRERSGVCNARFSDATSLETGIDDKPTDDIHVASSANPSIPETTDMEILNADDRMAADTPDSPCANNFTSRPLFDTKSPSTARNEVDPYSHVHALPEAPSIPTAIYCTQDENTRSSSPLIVGTTAAEADVDMTFEGPCLFGDSDLEEDD